MKISAGKRVWLVVIILILIIAAVFFFLFHSNPSIEEQLAAIEAACAIPDSENAAMVYNELLADPNATSLLDIRLDFLDDQSWNLTLTEPWLSKDFPELSTWITKHQYIIDKLLEVSQYEKCHFPISIPESVILPISTEQSRDIVELGRFLVRSANNDVVEGRIEQALEKYVCVIHMGRHCRQQPTMVDFGAWIALEGLGSQKIRFLIMRNEVTEEHLQAIETILTQSDEDWDQQREDMLKVETIYSKRLLQFGGLRSRIKTWWQYHNYRDPIIKRMRELHLQLLKDRRGSLILVQVRRYKNKSGHWPESLDDIQSQVPAGMLVDPLNKGPFVYKRTEDGFTLYSKGENNIDEGGVNTPKGPDDWLIWPPLGYHRKTEQP